MCNVWIRWQMAIKVTIQEVLNSYKLSVQFSHSVVSNSLQPHELQHTRPPCPSPTPPKLMSLSQWYHPTISSPCCPLLLLPSISASGSFQMNQLFVSGGQSTGASASTSILPMNTQDWFSARRSNLAVQGTLQSLLQQYSSKASISICILFVVASLLTL